MKRGDIVGVLLVLIILLGVGALVVFSPKAPEVNFYAEEVSGSALAVVSAKGEDAKVDATIVRAGFVTLNDAVGDAPGPVLGVSELLPAGEHDAVMIHPTQALEQGVQYYALMIVDDGDGVYEAGVDHPVTVDGQSLKVSFRAE